MFGLQLRDIYGTLIDCGGLLVGGILGLQARRFFAGKREEQFDTRTREALQLTAGFALVLGFSAVEHGGEGPLGSAEAIPVLISLILGCWVGNFLFGPNVPDIDPYSKGCKEGSERRAVFDASGGASICAGAD